MTNPTLGERIKARRDLLQDVADAARGAAQDWSKGYTDQIRTAVITYVDNRMDTAKSYVDSQIGAAKTYVDGKIVAVTATAKTYVDNQIAKLVAANNLKPPQ